MAKSFQEEIAERRAAAHQGFNSNGTLEWATADDVRAAAKAGAPQVVRDAMAGFQAAFNEFYNKPHQEPYRKMLTDMAGLLAQTNQPGLDRAQEIFKGLTHAGLSKAFAAHDQGRQVPGLVALVKSHEALDSAMNKLQKHIQQINALPNTTARHGLTQLAKPADPSDNEPKGELVLGLCA